MNRNINCFRPNDNSLFKRHLTLICLLCVTHILSHYVVFCNRHFQIIIKLLLTFFVKCNKIFIDKIISGESMKKNNIILIGMPGSGKSTAGVLFAKAMNYRFLDVDFLIQEHEGKRLYEVIEEKGNEYFLQIEDKVNCSLDTEKTVIATGGSVIYCEKAMEHLKTLGTVIYIKVPEKEIERRITNFSTRGIIIKSGDTLEDLYNERIPLYEKYADLTVLCDEKELQYNADKIMKEYLEYKGEI